MRDAARLIIPAWGERYVGKVLSIALPAVLAPGNLPALCEEFDVELVIVTETRLFDMVRNSASFQAAAKICTTQLTSLDDLLTDVPGDYGMVLTYALFRGFSDLGARMVETYLLFLNADFIISDGSLRHLGGLMSEGHRVIHAPSFRVVLEDVLPQLQEEVEGASSVLRVPSRDLVRLALANKHPTVTARTVNQRLRHQSWMDQYYWYVDEDTLIGYQSPVALVAIKPERVVGEPAIFWDYGFVADAAPNATPVFVTDSDDFFMIEPQARDTGSEMIRIGWFELDDMARKESLRATKEHRESGRQLLKIHAGDLPADLDRFAAESRAYMDEFYSRLAPVPAANIGHPLLGRWFAEASGRRRGGDGLTQRDVSGQKAPGAITPALARSPTTIAMRFLGGLPTIYTKMFGVPPRVSRFHPLWPDMAPVSQKLAAWRETGKTNILWIGPLGSVFDVLLSDRISPGLLLASDECDPMLQAKAPHDACIFHLTIDELMDLDRLYLKVRPLLEERGEVLVYVSKDSSVFDSADLLLKRADVPGLDVSKIHFFGTPATAIPAMLFKRLPQDLSKYSVVRVAAVGCAFILIAPLIWLANTWAERRDTAIFTPAWTSFVMEFTIKRGAR
jgi:hypothetical protein